MFFRITKLAVLAATLLLSVGAQAAFKPRVGLDITGSTATVTINRESAIRFRAANAGLSPAQRGEITAQRLTELIDAGLTPDAVGVKGDKTQARVFAGDKLICISTKADAQAARTDTLTLASNWANTIKRLLMMPPIILVTNEVTVPLGETRKIEVKGAAYGPITTKSVVPEIASATPGADGRYITVLGQNLGQTSIEVYSEGEKAVLFVGVKKYAGNVGMAQQAQVTGDPCPASTMCYAVKQSINRALFLEPGARAEIGEVSCPEGALGKGRTRVLYADVKITGADYIPFRTRTAVEVRNVNIPREELYQLFYSNAPERLEKYQTLFAGKLEQSKSTRLLYHHQNDIGKRARLMVELINTGISPAGVRIYRGVSKPMVDTVLVGYIAALNFLKDDTLDVSVIESIPGESRLVLVSDVLDQLDTASGIIQVSQLEGQNVYVRVSAIPPDQDVARVGEVSLMPSQLAMSLSDHIYPQPMKSLEAEYIVGQRWAFISVGKHAITDAAAQKKLYGNYGVTYDINVRVNNPTGQTKKIFVEFEPGAGLASGVFIINGQFVPIKYAKPPGEVKLTTYELKPGETRNMRIRTVPTAGSNYPITLIVRS